MAREAGEAPPVPPPPPATPEEAWSADGAPQLASAGGVPHHMAQLGDAEAAGADEPAAGQPPARDAAVDGDGASCFSPRFLKGKEREWDAVSHRPGPLTLLELPVDVPASDRERGESRPTHTAISLRNAFLLFFFCARVLMRGGGPDNPHQRPHLAGPDELDALHARDPSHIR